MTLIALKRQKKSDVGCLQCRLHQPRSPPRRSVCGQLRAKWQVFHTAKKARRAHAASFCINADTSNVSSIVCYTGEDSGLPTTLCALTRAITGSLTASSNSLGCSGGENRSSPDCNAESTSSSTQTLAKDRQRRCQRNHQSRSTKRSRHHRFHSLDGSRCLGTIHVFC
jgi:hypothetical protein